MWSQQKPWGMKLTTSPKNVMTDVSMVLDNFVSATMSKTDAINTLAAANKQLAEALAHATKQNEKLLTMVSQLTTNAMEAKPQKLGAPNSYCLTQGFVMGSNHDSKICHNKALGYKIEATKDNTMGGNMANKPTTKWWCTPAGDLCQNNNLVNSSHSTYTPVCAHTFLNNKIAHSDFAVSLSLLHHDAPATRAPNQQPPKNAHCPQWRDPRHH